MLSPSRRAFLGTALAGLASGRLLFAADSPSTPVLKVRDDPPFQPSTLFLTWQRKLVKQVSLGGTRTVLRVEAFTSA
jgi:hypothetical protein